MESLQNQNSEERPITEEKSNPLTEFQKIRDRNLPKFKAALPKLKEWLDRATYQEKLTALLSWQLCNKDHLLDGEDKHLSRKYDMAWEQEIIEKSKNAEYINHCEDKNEVAMTELAAFLIPWEA